MYAILMIILGSVFAKKREAKNKEVIFSMIFYFWYLSSMHVIFQIKRIKIVGVFQKLYLKVSWLGYVYKR